MSSRVLPLSCLLTLVCALGCSEVDGASTETPGAATNASLDTSTANGTSPSAQTGGQPELAPYQARLLDIAYQASSAFPLDPHIKNRSRAQESVVQACLELDQVDRALGYVEWIENWRREAARADCAFELVEDGRPEEARELLADAREFVRTAVGDDLDSWRRERVRSRIARVHLLLGENEQAAEIEKELPPAETIATSRVRAQFLEADELDGFLQGVRRATEVGGFEMTLGFLQACAVLHGRFYDDAERRAEIEETIKRGWKPTPLAARLDLLMELTENAIEHEDDGAALRLLADAREEKDSVKWLVRHELPLTARIAALMYRAGATTEARALADAGLLRYEKELATLPDVFRGEALRPLAEAYLAMEDRRTAGEIYTRAIEEGARNPNSRPRAEDLAATCCSLAVHGFEPSDAMWDRITAIADALGDPW